MYCIRIHIDYAYRVSKLNCKIGVTCSGYFRLSACKEFKDVVATRANYYLTNRNLKIDTLNNTASILNATISTPYLRHPRRYTERRIMDYNPIEPKIGTRNKAEATTMKKKYDSFDCQR